MWVKMNKTKAHTRYELKDGTRVPGVTTIIGLLNKPALIAWANKLGLDGIDSSKYVDDLAGVGTLAHELVQSHFTGAPIDYSEVSPKDVERAENCLKSFNAWVNDQKIEPILNEQELVSDKLKYGGKLDMYCTLNGKKTLVDFKSGKAIYDEYFYQLAAYSILLEEHGHPVEQAIIVRIGRENSEGFEVRSIDDLSKHKQVFGKLLDIYYLQRELKNASN